MPKRMAQRVGRSGGMFYIFATKLTNFLLCGDRNTRAVQKGKKMLKAKRQNTVCAFFETLLLVGR